MEGAIDDFGFMTSTSDRLYVEDICFIKDLVPKTEAELLEITNLGESGLTDVKNVLALKGLSLGMEV